MGGLLVCPSKPEIMGRKPRFRPILVVSMHENINPTERSIQWNDYFQEKKLQLFSVSVWQHLMQHAWMGSFLMFSMSIMDACILLSWRFKNISQDPLIALSLGKPIQPTENSGPEAASKSTSLSKSVFSAKIIVPP